MIYGATGYTGRMAAARAKQAGLPTLLAGRDAPPLRALAEQLQLDYRVYAVDDADALDSALAEVTVLLNCAGPFVHTAAPLMAACLGRGIHYLDIAAELDSYQLAAQLHAQAVDAGVMLMPGCGGSVAMLGSLAAHAIERVADPVSLCIALHVTGGMSRGSAATASGGMVSRSLMRRDDRLLEHDPADVREFDFGRFRASCFPVTLPDLITIARQSGIGNIATYVHVSGAGLPDGGAAALPDGPTAQEREANRYQAAVEVIDVDGGITRALLDTVNGYTFTPLAAIEAARRVLEGEVRAGFQTPTGLFGSGFAETIADTRIIDQPGTPAAHSGSNNHASR